MNSYEFVLRFDSLGFSFSSNKCLFETSGSTFLVSISLGTEKNMGFLKLNGLSVIKLYRLSLLNSLSTSSSSPEEFPLLKVPLGYENGI